MSATAPDAIDNKKVEKLNNGEPTGSDVKTNAENVPPPEPNWQGFGTSVFISFWQVLILGIVGSNFILLGSFTPQTLEYLLPTNTKEYFDLSKVTDSNTDDDSAKYGIPVVNERFHTKKSAVTTFKKINEDKAKLINDLKELERQKHLFKQKEQEKDDLYITIGADQDKLYVVTMNTGKLNEEEQKNKIKEINIDIKNSKTIMAGYDTDIEAMKKTLENLDADIDQRKKDMALRLEENIDPGHIIKEHTDWPADLQDLKGGAHPFPEDISPAVQKKLTGQFGIGEIHGRPYSYYTTHPHRLFNWFAWMKNSFLNWIALATYYGYQRARGVLKSGLQLLAFSDDKPDIDLTDVDFDKHSKTPSLTQEVRRDKNNKNPWLFIFLGLFFRAIIPLAIIVCAAMNTIGVLSGGFMWALFGCLVGGMTFWLIAGLTVVQTIQFIFTILILPLYIDKSRMWSIWWENRLLFLFIFSVYVYQDMNTYNINSYNGMVKNGLGLIILIWFFVAIWKVLKGSGPTKIQAAAALAKEAKAKAKAVALAAAAALKTAVLNPPAPATAKPLGKIAWLKNKFTRKSPTTPASLGVTTLTDKELALD